MSKKIFVDNWKFAEFPLGTAYDDMVTSPALSNVDVPHDWMIYHVSDLYKDSIGFYLKDFSLSPVPGHTYSVRFEGVYMNTDIYLNNEKIFEWKYGYSTFDVNLTDHLKDGENTLAVVCTYESPNTRWYSGAGIFRNVYFIEKNASYLPLDGIYISDKEKENGFDVTIDSEIILGSCESAVLKHTILDAEGKEAAVSTSQLTAAGELIKDSQVIFVSNPRRWDINDPYLYSVKTELMVNDTVSDTETNPLGFRTIAFDPDKGFFLNGRSVKINGVCQHHDLGALGSAMNKTALRRQLEKLLKMGVNSIRTSHNMPAKELMELADEMGILINSEAFDMWELPKTEHDYGVYFPEWYKTDVTSWVRRDRNHPSLIIWSIGNEIYDTHAGSGYKWTLLLRDATRELDYMHNAYIGIGSNYIEWDNAQKCSNELELSGYNYGERLYDAHHKKYPDWCIFGSETASTVQSRGIYHFPYETRLLTYEDGQCSSLGNCTTNWGARSVGAVVSDHRDRDFVFGQYLWTGWDYIGEPTPYFSKNSFFGQIDTAGYEKDTYYHYQAEWTDYKKSPMVHLLPYWDFNEGQIIDVCAYSNAPYVELFFNGVSQGKQFIDHLHDRELQGHWKLPYHEGELLVKAYDDDGNVVATDSQKSFSDPVSVMLSADKSELYADGKDLIFVDITTVDKNGTFVANAKNRVNVNVTGAARLVGLDNGDSTDYEEYKCTSRRLFSGRLLAIIAATGKAGEVNITVSSEGLKSASLSLSAIAPDSGYVAPCSAVNMVSKPVHEIPIRKILLKNLGISALNENESKTDVEFHVFPENATYSEVYFKALTKDAVEANFIKLNVTGNICHVMAIGDGDFRLTAFANNDKDHPEIISDLELSVTGLGEANHSAYTLVPGCEYSKSHTNDCQLSFQGGVFIPTTGDGYVSFDNIDFGDFGSDEITLPIFSFHDDVDLEVWEGSYDDKSGECLFKGTYHAKTWYNHYQENTFKLSRRIKGVTTVTIVFHIDERISLKGFVFKELKKAYERIPAVEASLVTGDSFTMEPDAITGIGNNVNIEFDGMDFSENGVSKVTIEGCSHNEKTSIHIMFMEGNNITRQMVEIPYSEGYESYTLPLEDCHSNGKISLVFLPGTNFDLKSIQFS